VCNRYYSKPFDIDLKLYSSETVGLNLTLDAEAMDFAGESS